ncbi:MAG: hypothetical protein J0H74_10665 [Chitinophagaceae bacterium]|nr:hypothetical protein [Chitinophagaceae bacterium]
MRPRDPRYEIIKPMLNEGKIQSFPDIFKFIKKSVVAADLGKRGPRFTELINRVEDFTVKELLIIARLCGLTEAEMFKLVEMELVKRKSKG